MIRAMAYHQLNETDKARTALTNGSDLANRKLAELKIGYHGNFSEYWFITHALMREARALIKS